MRKAMITLVILMAGAGLAACQSDDYKPPKPNADDRKACVARGGEYRQMGLWAIWGCLMPTKDAGQSCTAMSDCEDLCLAKEGRSPGTCAPVTPMFGCHVIIEEGEVMEMCID